MSRSTISTFQSPFRQPMPGRDFMSSSTCACKPVTAWDGYPTGEIQFCPLHSAAAGMLAVLEAALEQSGCDGDLCMYQWHEDARAAIGKAKEK